MRVVITGGTGLIGRALTRSLADDGHEVVVVSRAPERARDLPEGVSTTAWDAQSGKALAAALEGADAVVHLAGENIASGRWTAAKKRRIRDSRVDSSRAVAEAFERAQERPGVLVQASAVGYYGPRGEETITEESGPGSDYLARVSVEWESASAAVEKLAVRRPVVRTGVVLSPEGGALAKMLPPFRLFVGGPVGSGRQWFPWIHLADEVGAIRFLLEQEGADGPYHLTAPEPVTTREFSRALGKVLGRPSALPAPALGLRLALGEMAEILLEGQRALPSRLLEEGYRFRFAEAEGALRDLLG
ncbi:MAG: TIGR01777 family oxidoreductase [Thermoanaerobaculia bacterium]